jgi:small nuclear ribonucleoprotein (snRNP)-like protein
MATDAIQNYSFDETKPYFDLSTSKLTVEDAIKCLTGEYNVIVPTPNANLDEYLHKSTVNARRTSRDEYGLQTTSKKNPRRASNPSEPFAVPLVRNFERILKKTANSTQDVLASPSSMPTRPKKAKSDVFTKTEQIETNSGPLSHLKKRLNQVVKVIIRRRKKVPYISRVIEYKGILTMFDKHMNMFLKDVIESFNYQRDGKLLKRGRHRDGIMIRGDNVILVA